MSLECRECERGVGVGHAPDCSIGKAIAARRVVPPTREEILGVLTWLDRNIGGNPQFVDYRRVAQAYLAQFDELDAYKVGYRSIEAMLGTLDHVAAIDDESKLIDFVGAKVAKILTTISNARQATGYAVELGIAERKQHKELAVAAEKAIAKVRACGIEVDKYIVLHSARTGIAYSGPNWYNELKALEDECHKITKS